MLHSLRHAMLHYRKNALDVSGAFQGVQSRVFTKPASMPVYWFEAAMSRLKPAVKTLRVPAVYKTKAPNMGAFRL